MLISRYRDEEKKKVVFTFKCECCEQTIDVLFPFPEELTPDDIIDAYLSGYTEYGWSSIKNVNYSNQTFNLCPDCFKKFGDKNE